MEDPNLTQRPFSPPELNQLLRNMQSLYSSCIKSETEGIASFKSDIENILKMMQGSGLQGTLEYAQLQYSNPIFRILFQTSGGNENILQLALPFMYPRRTVDAVLQFLMSLKLNITGQLSKDAIAKQVLKLYDILGSIGSKPNLITQISSIADLQKEAPFIQWNKFFETTILNMSGRRIKSVKEIIIQNELPLTDLYSLIMTTDPRIIRIYILVQIIMESAYLPKIVRESVDKERPQFKTSCAESVYDSMPDIVRLSFVDNRFSLEDSIKTINELFPKLKKVVGQQITKSDWITPTSKRIALEKLAKMTLNIPVRSFLNLTDLKLRYSSLGLQFDRPQLSLFSKGLLMGRTNWHNQILSFINPPYKKTDDDGYGSREAFQLFTGTFYDPTTNTIHMSPISHTLRAWMDPSLPGVLQYGSFAQTIGHEITHAFHDVELVLGEEGRWWDESTARSFRNRTQCLKDQYSQFDFEPGKSNRKLNGSLTFRENMADHNGLQAAWLLYTQEKSNSPMLRGTLSDRKFSPDQLFFIGSVQKFCTTPRGIVSDYHAPGFIRATGMVANIPAFKQAFSCPASLKSCQVVFQ